MLEIFDKFGALVFVGARQRNQGFHGTVSGDFSGPNCLLNRSRQYFHQRQAAADPAAAAAKKWPKISLFIAVTIHQLTKQPPFFKGTQPAAEAQTVTLNQGFAL